MHKNITCIASNIIFYESGNAKPNIVSSFCTVTTFTKESWLSEGVYKDVFDLFNYQPSLKINVCDSNQSLVPFFSGHINWLSSEHTHFWHLAIRLAGTSNIFHWPELIYTNDIANVSDAFEKLIHETNTNDTNDFVLSLKQNITYLSKPLTDKLVVPVFHLPYYEGFNKDGSTSWLGIYRRDELFPIKFLRDLCNICLETKIGQFYTTSWKSIIIKGIQETNRNLWDNVLGTYRINVRHAANELNWQVEDMNEDALILERSVIRHFDIEDVRTDGLSFAVKTKLSPGIFGSVVISKQPAKNKRGLKSMDPFQLLHTRDFNPNSTDLVSFRKDIGKEHLGIYLVSLCKFFYERGSLIKTTSEITKVQPAADAGVTHLYQCDICLSVYDENVGEPDNNIIAGTTFSELPGSYACPLCESGKDQFKSVLANVLVSK